MSAQNVVERFRCAPLSIKKALGIFRPLENWYQQQEEEYRSSFLGPASRVQKFAQVREALSPNCGDKDETITMRVWRY